MSESKQQIRNSAKAIIIRNGKLLVTRNRDSTGDYFLLPGGGQRHGETLREALQRECWEEIGTGVRIGDLKLVREYIGKNHEFAAHDGDAHQLEFMFLCEIAESYSPSEGSEPDGPQTGVVWLPMESLGRFRIYPSVLVRVLEMAPKEQPPVYLGDVN